MGRGMCVDTRVIPIALGEHTLITLTYLWGACVPHLPACARVCMRACVCEGITMCVYHLCVWLLSTYVCDYTHKNFTTLDYSLLPSALCLLICVALWLCLRTRLCIDDLLLWYLWSLCHTRILISSSVMCESRNISGYLSVWFGVLCCGVVWRASIRICFVFVFVNELR